MDAIFLTSSSRIVFRSTTYITFQNHESALNAIRDMNGKTYKGRILTVSKRRDRDGHKESNKEHNAKDDYDGRTLCMKNVPRIPKEELKAYYSKSGKVIAVDFIMNEVFVTYEVMLPFQLPYEGGGV